jgi:membrane-associated phospholipid phosphatase
MEGVTAVLLPSPSAELQRRWWPLCIGVLYVASVIVLGGFRGDHLVFGLLCLLDYYNTTTRNILKYFLPFILTAVMYDSMRYFYWQGVTGHIYVKEPYFRDLSWFGINVLENGLEKRLTPNEFFAVHHWVGVDFICGLAYLTFIGEYLSAGIYLFIKNRFEILKIFGWSFFIVNALGYLTYYIYPAAPPWYVSEYGLGEAKLHIAPESGAAVRFDDIFGTHFFKGMYGRGVDVYGAYPSLHVAYPLLVFFITLLLPQLKKWRLPAFGFYILMCFSAVYLQHHYVVDIVLGTLYAIIVSAGALLFTPLRRLR